MVIAGLVIGILSVSVFFWAGPTIGGLWAASEALSSSMSGNSAIPPVWPIWAVGIGVGVGIPAVSLILSIAGMMKDQPKGIGIAGIITSAVGMILGFLMTAGAAFAINIASAAKDSFSSSAKSTDAQQMQNTLNDPGFQDRIQQAMDAAAKQNAQGNPSLGAVPAPAAPSPDALMPGQVLPGASPNPSMPSSPAEALPAEAAPAAGTPNAVPSAGTQPAANP